MKAKQILGIVVGILALLLLLAGWWGYQQNSEKLGLMKENEGLTSELSDMQNLKMDLEREIDSLQVTYNALEVVNDSLQTSLTEAKETINRRDRSIRVLKTANKKTVKSNEAELGSLRDQIQSLLATKATLEASILNLQSENDSLRVRTGVLEQDLSTVREEKAALSSLNTSMEKELKRLTLANFQASAFRVEVEKRKPKVTSKSRRAKRIKVSFDLTNVPEEYQGVRPVYLAITDEKSTPIKLKNPIKAMVKINGQATDIIAAEAKEVNVTPNQRLSFTHDLAQKLRKGYYRILVYTDVGLLGASSVQLR
ncbi:MAG: hypothetical protein AAGG75_21995 [Bacteroidota bacterium]